MRSGGSTQTWGRGEEGHSACAHASPELLGPCPGSIPSSKACGPFINYNTTWEVIPKTVSTFPGSLQSVVHGVTSEAFAVPFFMIIWWVRTTWPPASISHWGTWVPGHGEMGAHVLYSYVTEPLRTSLSHLENGPNDSYSFRGSLSRFSKTLHKRHFAQCLTYKNPIIITFLLTLPIIREITCSLKRNWLRGGEKIMKLEACALPRPYH